MSEKIDVVKQWIEKADHDLGTAQVTYLSYQNIVIPLLFIVSKLLKNT